MINTDAFLSAFPAITDMRGQLPRHVTIAWRKRKLSELEGMVWHQSLSAGSADALARYHVNPNHIARTGLPGISYTFFVEPGGEILLCNSLEDTTYSQGDRTKPGDENRIYLAGCFGGNFDAPGYRGSMVPTVEQLHGGLTLWRACRSAFGFDNDELYGHYHFGKSTCPGTTLSRLIDAIRDDETGAVEGSGPDFSTIASRQFRLKQLNFYAGKIDGIWGLKSRAALTRYQKERDLAVDGIWGPQTERAMRNE